MCPLSIAAADANTPEPTYGIPASSSNPWIVPSSPHGPCSTGKTTSTSRKSPTAASAGRTSIPPCVGSPASTTCAPVVSTAGSRPSVIRSRSGSSRSATHRPSVVIPIGTTS